MDFWARVTQFLAKNNPVSLPPIRGHWGLSGSSLRGLKTSSWSWNLAVHLCMCNNVKEKFRGDVAYPVVWGKTHLVNSLSVKRYSIHLNIWSGVSFWVVCHLVVKSSVGSHTTEGLGQQSNTFLGTDQECNRACTEPRKKGTIFKGRNGRDGNLSLQTQTESPKTLASCWLKWCWQRTRTLTQVWTWKPASLSVLPYFFWNVEDLMGPSAIQQFQLGGRKRLMFCI